MRRQRDIGTPERVLPDRRVLDDRLDHQVGCDEVQQLTTEVTWTGADMTLVHLTDVAHTLKVDASRSPAQYTADLPFSPDLRTAISAWAAG